MSVFECIGLSKSYGSVRALDQVDLNLEPGRIVGLLGPNGSGKTTMIKLAMHLLVPSSGSIRICGMEPGRETKALVSYLPDRDILPQWMRVGELVKLYQDFYPDFQRERAQEMLESLQIPQGLTLQKLSKGNREKVSLCLAMSRQAKVYLLDEPIAGVDPAGRDYILRTILQNYSPDALVLISTHLIADVEQVLDEVIFLQRGRVVVHESADTLRENTGKSVDEYFREVFRC